MENETDFKKLYYNQLKIDAMLAEGRKKRQKKPVELMDPIIDLVKNLVEGFDDADLKQVYRIVDAEMSKRAHVATIKKMYGK